MSVMASHTHVSTLCVFLMRLRPPISTRTATLSPYTTLFRSPYAPGFQAHRQCPRRRRAKPPARTTTRPTEQQQEGGWALSHPHARDFRSEEHTSELQSLMRNSYAVFCLKKKK